MAIKVGFVSLGCPKNLVNTEMMISLCAAAGYEIVADDIDADVIVINTCAFIQSAKQEAIDNIIDIAWLKKNRGLKGIVVAGCLAERYGKEIFKEMPEVDAVIGTGADEGMRIHRSVEPELTGFFAQDQACGGDSFHGFRRRCTAGLLQRGSAGMAG